MVRLVTFLLVATTVSVAFTEDREPEVKILVPAYFYPAGDGLKTWDRLIEGSARAPVVAIVNPASGPGKKVDPEYTAVLKKAKASKLTLIGYVSTNYAKRTVKEVKGDIDLWVKLYPGLHGLFFDEQASDAKHIDYYADLSRHARNRIPKALIVANPGTGCADDYFQKKTADVWCVDEGTKAPSSFTPPAAYVNYPSSNFCLLTYGFRDPAKVSAEVSTARKRRVGYVFLTNDVLPNPWDTLPPYWDVLVESVAGLNK